MSDTVEDCVILKCFKFIGNNNNASLVILEHSSIFNANNPFKLTVSILLQRIKLKLSIFTNLF